MVKVGRTGGNAPFGGIIATVPIQYPFRFKVFKIAPKARVEIRQRVRRQKAHVNDIPIPIGGGVGCTDFAAKSVDESGR